MRAICTKCGNEVSFQLCGINIVPDILHVSCKCYVCGYDTVGAFTREGILKEIKPIRKRRPFGLIKPKYEYEYIVKWEEET